MLRTDLSGDPTFRELLARAREAALGAYANQDMPFERMVDALHPERDLSRIPLFQVLFILQNTPVAPLALSGLTLRQLDVDAGAAKFDITLSLVAGEAGYVGHLEYNTDLFDTATIERMASHFVTLLAGVAANPERRLSQLPVLTRPSSGSCSRSGTTPTTTCRRTSASTTCSRRRWSGRRTRSRSSSRRTSSPTASSNARANQLAQALRKLGVGPDVLVGVFAERSIELMVGLLGIHKAGGAYVPLDPTYPTDRLAFMVEDSGAPVLLTQRRLLDRLPESDAKVVCLDRDWDTISREREEAPVRDAGSNNLAYVIYTSGSTGKPKGVMVEHRNVVNFFAGMDERLGADAPGTWLAVTSLSFDISVLELFWTLTRGFKVVDSGRAGCVAHGARRRREPFVDRTIDFSLFYFASDEADGRRRQVPPALEGAKFADADGFAAVWTPERHFHAFGGLYPNPAVTSAAIAAITEAREDPRRQRGAAAAQPDPRRRRVVGGRQHLERARRHLRSRPAGSPTTSCSRRRTSRDAQDVMLRDIEIVRQLWRGEAVTFQGRLGQGRRGPDAAAPGAEGAAHLGHRRRQPRDLPRRPARSAPTCSPTCSARSVEELAEKIAVYRKAWREPATRARGTSTLMLHTFVGDDDAGA